MQLDWITLYDYMTIFSRSQIKSKINKFYESFYPLKFKRPGKKSLDLKHIERGGLLGIVASYIQENLFVLQIYLEAEYFLSSGKIKQDIKLSKMFVEIEKQNLEISLDFEKLSYTINEAYKIFSNTPQDKTKDIGFLEIKLVSSLIRLFQFFYTLQDMKKDLNEEGFEKLENNLRLFSFRICQKSKNHIKLFPEIGQILIEILHFFSSEAKENFNFYSHLSEQSKSHERTFPQRIKKLMALIPNKQKNILVNLSDETFFEYLLQSGINIPRQPIENYFRCEEEINSIIAEEQNFIESILISEKYRGSKQWKQKVMEQLVNLSVEKKVTENTKIFSYKHFKLSEDFPLNF